MLSSLFDQVIYACEKCNKFQDSKSIFMISDFKIFLIMHFKPLIHGQINLIRIIWHIFWIKNCSIKFDVYTTKLVWSKLIKLLSMKWVQFRLIGVIQRSSTFFAVWKIFEFVRVEWPKTVIFPFTSFSKGKYNCEQRCI